MNTVEHGPYPLQITDGLDFYKATMSQVAYETHPTTQVTFELTNRGNQRLADYVTAEDLQRRLDYIGQQGFTQNEATFLASIQADGKPLFSDSYIESIRGQALPPVHVTYKGTADELRVAATGDWSMVTFWETIVMSELNEAYFEAYTQANNIDLSDVYDEGDARLTQKIERLKTNPGIRFADFGTRRHFSYRWQRHVVERLAQELPNQCIGTSNIGLAKELNITPIGTFAHEMPMVYAALADKNSHTIRNSHGVMLDDWFKRYGEQLSIALTDTFGSNFFFADFGRDRAAAWRGVRHDSGNPITFGETVIDFYTNNGIDPTAKTIVFSDGLDIDEIEALYNHFNERINIVFGWGTKLTNDLGIPPLNIVMKAVCADGIETVKLSDVPTKHTGSTEKVNQYEYEFST